MSTATENLVVNVDARGAMKAGKELGGVAAGADKVARSSRGAGQALAGAFSPGLLGQIRTAGLLVAGATLAGVKSASTFQHTSSALAAAWDLTAEQQAELQQSIKEISMETGVATSDLLAAARAAGDMGAEMDQILPILDDLHKASALWGMSLQDVSPAIGAVLDATRGQMSSQQALGVVGTGVQASGIEENVYLDLLNRFLPQLDGSGFEDAQEAIAIFTGAVAGLGEDFIADEKQLKKYLKDFTKGAKEMGLRSDQVGDHILSMVKAVQSGQIRVSQVPEAFRPFIQQLLTSPGAMEKFIAASEKMSGSAAEMDRKFQEKLSQVKLDEFAVAWNALKLGLVELGTAVLPMFSDGLKAILKMAGYEVEEEWALDKGVVGKGWKGASAVLERYGLQGMSVRNDPASITDRGWLDERLRNRPADPLEGLDPRHLGMNLLNGVDTRTTARPVPIEPPRVTVNVSVSPDGVVASARDENSGRGVPTTTDSTGRETQVQTRR